MREHAGSSAKAVVVSLAILACLGRAGVAAAQVRPWTNTGVDGAVAVLATDPMVTGTVYVGTSRGMFRSVDGGGTWVAIGNGMTGYERLSVLAVDPVSPTTLYTGGAEGMVYDGAVLYKSTDGGDSWGRTWCCGYVVTALAVDPLTPTTLYAGAHHYLSSTRGVFKSTNGGGAWTAVLMNALVSSLAIDPLTPTTIFAGTDGGVQRTTDEGATWATVNAGLTDLNVHALVLDRLTPTTLYAGTAAGVFKSIDAGESWSAVNRGLDNLDITALAIDGAAPAILYAGTRGGGVFKSTDAGGDWSAINDGLTDLAVGALAIDAAGTTIYAGTNAGLFALDQSAAKAEAPTFSPPGGTYLLPQLVSISDASPGVTIYYTTDGRPPTTSSTRYSGPILVVLKTTIRAMAVAPGCSPSAEARATYRPLLGLPLREPGP